MLDRGAVLEIQAVPFKGEVIYDSGYSSLTRPFGGSTEHILDWGFEGEIEEYICHFEGMNRTSQIKICN